MFFPKGLKIRSTLTSELLQIIYGLILKGAPNIVKGKSKGISSVILNILF